MGTIYTEYFSVGELNIHEYIQSKWGSPLYPVFYFCALQIGISPPLPDPSSPCPSSSSSSSSSSSLLPYLPSLSISLIIFLFMATVVYRSRLESQLSEPKAIRLKLSSPTPPFELALKSCLLDQSNNQNNPSFLQAVSCGTLSISRSERERERERTYIHPLSEKSLALCTEDLGNETGSDVTDNDIFSSSVEKENNGRRRRRRMSSLGLNSRKGNVNPSFPPPLTSMIQLRPHREDGRLVLKATKAPSRTTCFQAERSNGRLRLSLSLLKDDSDSDSGALDRLNRTGSGRCVEGDREKMGIGFPFSSACWVASS